MKMSIYESSAITLVRVFAMCSIVLCHFQQALEIKWAWVFNVGVQIFFVLSGYLYGHKDIDNWIKWFIQRFIKLYVPLYIYTTIALTFILYLSDTPVSWIHYLKAGGVSGLNHLWFMKAIALCYLITPVLQLLKRYSLLVLVFWLMLGIFEYVYFQKMLFVFSWLWLYSFGYLYASSSSLIRHIIKLIALAFTTFIIANISWDDILHYNCVNNRCFHDFLGITLCICGISCLTLLKVNNLPSLLKILDKNSFYLYITHHLFLLGPLSLISITPLISMNILLIFVLIILSTWGLSLMSSHTIVYINKVLK